MNVDVLTRRDPPLLGRNIFFSFLLFFFLPRWIRKNAPDILHVHTGPGGVLLSRRPSLPLIVTANHTYAQQSKLKGQAWKRIFVPLERYTYQCANRILCLSQDTARSVREDYGIDSAKIAVIPCSVDVPAFAAADKPFAERKKICVFTGRRDYRKGFDLLSEAWDIVQRSVPDAALHIVGFTGHSTSSMIFHGHLSDAELQTLVGSARCVVCPSRLEGFGLAAAEAIAAGTPVVATNVDGLRCVVENEKTGLLTDVHPADIASKIISLLTDDSLWVQLHSACQANRHVFLPEREIEKYTGEYLRYTRK